MNIVNFYIKKISYYFLVYLNRAIAKKPNNKNFRKVKNDLDKNGICFLEDFFTKKETKKMLLQVRPKLQSLIKRPNKKMKYYRNSNEGIFRLYEISKLCPATKKFFNLKFIRNFTNYYISNKASMYQEMGEIRQKVKLPLGSLKLSSDHFHFDDWRIRLKFFLILTDTNKSNSPLQYIPKSHLINKTKMEKDLFFNGKKGRYGFYTKNEVNKILKKTKLKVKFCVAKAGTLIIVNTNGIHRGTPLVDKKKPRIQLGIYGDIRKKKWSPKNINI